MKVWVTRTEPGASRTARRLKALGHEPLVEPVLEVHPLPAAIDLGGVGALAFTSGNGLHAFAKLNPDRGLPVFTVGEATAKAAREAGFGSVMSAGGDVQALAMLIVIAGFPGAFVHAFFTGSLLIETVFSLDGLGLLSFESIVNRDYAVVFATLYIFSLIGLVVNLLSDLTYTWIDPRIDFETREV